MAGSLHACRGYIAGIGEKGCVSLRVCTGESGDGRSCPRCTATACVSKDKRRLKVRRLNPDVPVEADAQGDGEKTPRCRPMFCLRHQRQDFHEIRPTAHRWTWTSALGSKKFNQKPQSTAKMTTQYDNISSDLIWEITRTCRYRPSRSGEGDI